MFQPLTSVNLHSQNTYNWHVAVISTSMGVDIMTASTDYRKTGGTHVVGKDRLRPA